MMAHYCQLILLWTLVAASGCATASLRRPARLSETTLRGATVLVQGSETGSSLKAAPVVAISDTHALAVMPGVSGASDIAKALRAYDLWVAGRTAACNLGGLVGCLSNVDATQTSRPKVQVSMAKGDVRLGHVIALDSCSGTALVEFAHHGKADELRSLFIVPGSIEPGRKLYVVPDLGPQELTGRLVQVTTRKGSGSRPDGDPSDVPLLIAGESSSLSSGSVLLSASGELAGFVQMGTGSPARVLAMNFLKRDPFRARFPEGAVTPALAPLLLPGEVLSVGGPATTPWTRGSIEIRVQGSTAFGIAVIGEGQESALEVSLFDVNGDVDLLGLTVSRAAHIGARQIRLPPGRYRLQIRGAEDPGPAAGWHVLSYESPSFPASSSRAAIRDHEAVTIAIAVTELVSLIADQARRGARHLRSDRFARHLVATMELMGMRPGLVAMACLDHLGHEEPAARLAALRMVGRAIGEVEPRLWQVLLRAESLEFGTDGLPGLSLHNRDPDRLRAQGRAAALLLSTRHPRDRRLHGFIAEAAGEPDAIFRRMALSAANRSGVRRLAVEISRRLRDDSDPQIRSQARSMLGQR